MGSRVDTAGDNQSPNVIISNYKMTFPSDLAAGTCTNELSSIYSLGWQPCTSRVEAFEPLLDVDLASNMENRLTFEAETPGNTITAREIVKTTNSPLERLSPWMFFFVITFEKYETKSQFKYPVICCLHEKMCKKVSLSDKIFQNFMFNHS